ncbi:hypothetical protein Q5P01_003585 [Channa striata]|uniref:Uncharacterized protein n=1 Tax=Channa striata TaxID=64152 RepID=A0AA88NSQ0_CHASR|nr:hypothetical protein Q5P01_003585 [Channa striata]
MHAPCLGKRGGACIGGARSAVVTSRKRPSGEATSGRAGKDGKEGKTAGTDRRETGREESVSPRLGVNYFTTEGTSVDTAAVIPSSQALWIN